MDQSPPLKRKPIIVYSILITVAVLALVALVFFIYQTASAAEKIAQEISFMKNVRSLRADIEFFNNTARMRVDYQSNTKKFSKVTLMINKLNFKKKDNLKTEAIVNNKDLFLTVSYSHMRTLLQTFEAAYMPALEQLDSYTLLKPFLFERKALHISIKPYLQTDNTTVKDIMDPAMRTELNEMLMNTLIIRPSRWRASFSRIGPTRYKIGFKKDRLLAYLERVKSIDSDVSQQQYDSLKAFISSVDNWDADLIIIDLDRRGRIDDLELYAPAIPQTYIDQYVKQDAASNALVPATDAISEITNDFALHRKKGANDRRTRILRINIQNYNEVPAAKPPNKYIELQDVIHAFEQQESLSPTPTPKALPIRGPIKKGFSR